MRARGYEMYGEGWFQSDGWKGNLSVREFSVC
jgi:hypothetical protein